MQAVIMAGGKGTRLSSITKNIPKPMVPVDGKPLLEYQIEDLRENGIDNIIIVVGYLGNVIQKHFGDGADFGVKITYYTEKVPLGTAGALPELYNRLEDIFVLVFGDLFVDVSYQRFVEFHIQKKAALTLFAHPNSHPYDSDIVIADDDFKVTGWNYKNTERKNDYKNLVNAGLYVIEKSILKKFPVHQKIDLEKDVISCMIPDGGVYAYCSTEYVKDIGTPDRLEKVTQDYKSGICGQRNLKNPQKCIFMDRDGTINKFVGFLKSADQVELEEGVADAVRMINQSEYLAIVITNQPVVARGECSFEELEYINNKIHTLLGKEGAYIDGMYICPHHPDSGFEGEVKELKIKCNCRKPNVGMLLDAKRDFNIDLGKSWMVGDTDVDVQTGINGGLRTVLLKSGDSRKKLKGRVAPDFEADNLFDAVSHILNTPAGKSEKA